MATIINKIKNTVYVLFIVFVSTSMYSCKKEGTGGNSTIQGVVKHHSLPIPNATVYIKYGAREFPGESTGSYDASVIADASGNYIFSNLVKGDYYLYGYGYDASIFEDVKGGVAVSVKKNKTATMDVPVTE